jgi:F-type H+-transporting ATPase subunit b
MFLNVIQLLTPADLDRWLNYPGLELWKFLDLGIFLAAAIFLLKRRMRDALEARRESIRSELLKAQRERDDAIAQLAAAEALLARLDSDVAALRDEARKEAELERERLRAATDAELEKLRLEAQKDIERAGKIARQELRRFLALRSVQLARESVIRDLRPEDDVRLIASSIAELKEGRI